MRTIILNPTKLIWIGVWGGLKLEMLEKLLCYLISFAVIFEDESGEFIFNLEVVSVERNIIVSRF